MDRTKRYPRGFTLIEMLVVVSIIAVLVAILLPSLRSAREQCKQVVCRNNLRNIWTGVLMYTWDHRDRVPFLEDVNLNDPNADPFDPAYPTTVGRMLLPFVNSGSWRCPSAVAGFPADAGKGGWKMTYTFSVAGPVGEGVPYDSARANAGGPLDPAVSNYVHFDGRPLRLIDGRRYVQGSGLNRNRKGFWNVKRAVIADALAGEPSQGKPRYPHSGVVAKRTDLRNARPQFETNTHTNEGGRKPAYHELHADGEKTQVYLTRFWMPHWPGY